MLTHDLQRYLGSGRWLLLAMLGLLHIALMVGIDAMLIHPLLLAHLGLFLLWQPLWRGERQVSAGALVFISIAGLGAMFWLSWWTLAFWVTGLFGLVGARVFVFHDRWARVLYLLVMAYLLAMLLLWVVPNLFAGKLEIEAGRVLALYVMPMILLLMGVMPVKSEPPEGSESVDFVYSLLLFMLLTLVVLGSLAFMSLGKLDYLGALLRTLLLMGLALLALGWLWNPRFGFSGLQLMFSRYLLNVGTPFENWLSRLTDAVQREPNTASYLRTAMTLMSDLPWLSGLSWQAPDGAGQSGEFSGYAAMVQEGDLRLTVYAKQELHPALLLHVQLLAQLIGYFYRAKQQEQRLRQLTRLQAVYETGSRLTHDLKNMLQSLFSLTSIAQGRDERAQLLLQQQLPLLAQRIEAILGKLQQPQVEIDAPVLELSAWWEALRQRNQHLAIQWRAPNILPDTNIPAAMFDCVAENLIDNALKKAQSEKNISISVEIRTMPLRLMICDTGSAVPENIASSLLSGVVVSDSGLGIGLYQSAHWAEQVGYGLKLAGNKAGSVCFELTSAKKGKF